MVLANVVHQRILGAARLSFSSGNLLINKLPICFLLPYFIFICFYSLYYYCYFTVNHVICLVNVVTFFWLLVYQHENSSVVRWLAKIWFSGSYSIFPNESVLILAITIFNLAKLGIAVPGNKKFLSGSLRMIEDTILIQFHIFQSYILAIGNTASQLTVGSIISWSSLSLSKYNHDASLFSKPLVGHSVLLWGWNYSGKIDVMVLCLLPQFFTVKCVPHHR